MRREFLARVDGRGFEPRLLASQGHLGHQAPPHSFFGMARTLPVRAISVNYGATG